MTHLKKTDDYVSSSCEKNVMSHQNDGERLENGNGGDGYLQRRLQESDAYCLRRLQESDASCRCRL